MIRFTDAEFTIPALIKSVLFGDVGFGDAYMRGDILVYEDLAQWLAKNKCARRLLPYIPTTTRRVDAHYDIKPEFYEILLGESMSYTCANWPSQASIISKNLNLAQIEKFSRHINWLDIDVNAGKNLKHLDCGSGWGSFMDAVKKSAPDCQIDGLTLSIEQAAYVNNKFPDLDKVYVGDWKDVDAIGKYDRFSAIGMLEHVGRSNFNEFFAWISKTLNPSNGVGVLQFCSRDTPISLWTDKHIFPGAEPPTLNEVSRHMRRNGLYITDLVECGGDYVHTLRCWLDNLESNLGAIRDLGYNEQFIRMFRLYLNGGICSFDEGNTQLIQLRFEN